MHVNTHNRDHHCHSQRVPLHWLTCCLNMWVRLLVDFSSLFSHSDAAFRSINLHPLATAILSLVGGWSQLLRMQRSWYIGGKWVLRCPTKPNTKSVVTYPLVHKWYWPFKLYFIFFIIVRTLPFPWQHLKCLSPCSPSVPIELFLTSS